MLSSTYTVFEAYLIVLLFKAQQSAPRSIMFPPKNPHRERKRRIRGLVPIMGVLILTIFVVVSMLSGMAPAEDQLESSPNGIMRHVLNLEDSPATPTSRGPTVSSASAMGDPHAGPPLDIGQPLPRGLHSEQAPDQPDAGILDARIRLPNQLETLGSSLAAEEHCLFWKVSFDGDDSRGLWDPQLSEAKFTGSVMVTTKKMPPTDGEKNVHETFNGVALFNGYRKGFRSVLGMKGIPRTVQDWMEEVPMHEGVDLIEVWQQEEDGQGWKFIGVISKDNGRRFPFGVRGPKGTYAA